MVTVAAERALSISRLQTLVKWLAIATMVVDHVGAVLLPDVLVLRVVGRFAYPAFVGLIAFNVGVRGVSAVRYLKPMAVFAMVSQVPYWLAGFSGLNIFVTLGAGLLVWAIVRGELPAWWGAALVVLPWAQYGPLGVAGVTVAVAGTHWRSVLLLAGSGALLLAAQGSAVWAVATVAVVVADVALVAAAVALAGRVPAIPRGPKWVFYGFYPVHLLVLVGVRLVLL